MELKKLETLLEEKRRFKKEALDLLPVVIANFSNNIDAIRELSNTHYKAVFDYMETYNQIYDIKMESYGIKCQK